jgi:hypothetical protein
MRLEMQISFAEIKRPVGQKTSQQRSRNNGAGVLLPTSRTRAPLSRAARRREHLARSHPPDHVKSRTSCGHGQSAPPALRAHTDAELPFSTAGAMTVWRGAIGTSVSWWDYSVIPCSLRKRYSIFWSMIYSDLMLSFRGHRGILLGRAGGRSEDWTRSGGSKP